MFRKACSSCVNLSYWVGVLNLNKLHPTDVLSFIPIRRSDTTQKEIFLLSVSNSAWFSVLAVSLFHIENREVRNLHHDTIHWLKYDS